MTDTTAQKLTSAEVATAIRDIMEGGQKVVVGDREYTAGDLDDLRKLYNEVSAAERSANGTMFIRATFGRVC